MPSQSRIMDSPTRFPSTPGMPLFSLSPDKLNARSQTPTKYPDFGGATLNISPSKLFGHSELGIPGDFSNKPIDLTVDDFTVDNEFVFKSPFAKSDSTFKVPSLPGSPTRHARAQSDVHGMVARFDTLNIKDHDEARKKHTAALKRAEMGREEAEAEAKRLRDELAEMRLEVEDYKTREIRVMKRLDSMTDELHSAKESKAHAQTLYEKEIRKARKEAFKASSSLVKLQEELKSARNTLRSLQNDLETERARAASREQEAFDAQYQLAGIQEDLGAAQARLKIAEEEREALKTSLKEEEVARIAAEGRIALPSAEDDDDEFASPKKTKRRSSCRQSISPPRMSLSGAPFTLSEELEQLRDELEAQRRQCESAKETIAHMNMECHFGCCSCKLAEQQKGIATPAAQQIGLMKSSPRLLQNKEGLHEPARGNRTPEQDPMSIDTTTPYCRSPNDETSPSTQPPPPSTPYHHPHPNHTHINPQPQAQPHPFRTSTTTTTTTIPLTDHSATPPPQSTSTTTVHTAEAPAPDYSSFSTPSGLTRAQAIEQLRARRGRAKSVVLSNTLSASSSSSSNGSATPTSNVNGKVSATTAPGRYWGKENENGSGMSLMQQTPGRRDVSAASAVSAPEVGRMLGRVMGLGGIGEKRVVSK